MKEFFYNYEFDVYNKRLKKEVSRFLLGILNDKEATIRELQTGIGLAKKVFLIPGMIVADDDVQHRASNDCLEMESSFINNALGETDG